MNPVSDQYPLVLCLTVVTGDESKAAHTAEVIGRAAAGLMLDGIDVNLSFAQTEIEQQAEETNDVD